MQITTFARYVNCLCSCASHNVKWYLDRINRHLAHSPGMPLLPPPPLFFRGFTPQTISYVCRQKDMDEETIAARVFPEGDGGDESGSDDTPAAKKKGKRTEDVYNRLKVCLMFPQKADDVLTVSRARARARLRV